MFLFCKALRGSVAKVCCKLHPVQLFELLIAAPVRDTLGDTMFKPSARRVRAALLATTAIALTPAIAAAADEADVAEVVVVARPILDAQAAAIAQQRDADNIVSIVAADAVGRFPDQSAAAALSRVPGVAIERDQGQERYVQLRGAPTGHVVNIREVRLAAGAEFIVMICGDIMTMPGLPKTPASDNIDIDDSGKIVGLF